MGLGTLMARRGEHELELGHHREGCSHKISHPFVQHLVLDPARPGADLAGFKVISPCSATYQTMIRVYPGVFV